MLRACALLLLSSALGGAVLLLAADILLRLVSGEQNVMQLLRGQCAQGKAALVVLHDLTLASRFCDRLLLLDQGRVVDCGTTRQVLTPKNLQQVYRVQAMLGEHQHQHQHQRFVLPWACGPQTSQPLESL